MLYIQYYCKNYKELCECYDKYFSQRTNNNPKDWFDITKQKVNKKGIYILDAGDRIMFNWGECNGVKTIFKAKVYDL